jgi:hypothetical protein
MIQSSTTIPKHTYLLHKKGVESMNYRPSFEEKTRMLSIKYDVYYNQDIMDIFEKAFKLHVDLTPFYSSLKVYSEEEIMDNIYTQIKKLYRIQFHNVGKNPYKRYFAMDTHFDWLKLEHYLISFFYAIQNNKAYISNPKIAMALGWLAKDEMNSETIRRATRRVTEALRVLKEDRKTFTVEHRYREGESGSYHVIMADWLVIIPKYQQYDPSQAISIRERKGIRYRIISFLYKSAKSFSNDLRKLMRKQKEKYLYKIITMDIDNFSESRFWWQFIMDHYQRKWGSHSLIAPFGPKYLVPEYNHPNMILHVKDETLYQEVKRTSDILMAELLKIDFNIHLTIVRA